jgi:hypothetical protein
MIELGSARECEVVLAFLKAEVASLDYSKYILPRLARRGLSRGQLIDNPDPDNAHDNLIRQEILGEYRGYGRGESLFCRFPSDVRWRRVELEPHEFGRLKYIREDEDKNWMSYSQGTRLPQRVAERIARGELPGLEKKVCGIQEKLRRGALLPEIIAAEGEKGDLILIEGHCRATAYVGLNWSGNIPMFLGSSPQMHMALVLNRPSATYLGIETAPGAARLRVSKGVGLDLTPAQISPEDSDS